MTRKMKRLKKGERERGWEGTNDAERARTYQIKIVWFKYTYISERRTRRKMVGLIMDWMMEGMEGMDSSRIWFRSQNEEEEWEEEEGRRMSRKRWWRKSSDELRSKERKKGKKEKTLNKSKMAMNDILLCSILSCTSLFYHSHVYNCVISITKVIFQRKRERELPTSYLNQKKQNEIIQSSKRNEEVC